MPRQLVFDHAANPYVDAAIYTLSAARGEDMIASKQAFRVDNRRIQKYPPLPEELSNELLAQIPGSESKAALTPSDSYANVGIGGSKEPGTSCPPQVIRRAQARIKGWSYGRPSSPSSHSRRVAQPAYAFASSLLSV